MSLTSSNLSPGNIFLSSGLSIIQDLRVKKWMVLTLEEDKHALKGFS